MMSGIELNKMVRRPRSTAPKEPALLLREVADKMGVTTPRLRGLMAHYPLRRPEPVMSYRGSSCAKQGVGLYNLSDFKRWAYINDLEVTC